MNNRNNWYGKKKNEKKKIISNRWMKQGHDLKKHQNKVEYMADGDK